MMYHSSGKCYISAKPYFKEYTEPGKTAILPSKMLLVIKLNTTGAMSAKSAQSGQHLYANSIQSHIHQRNTSL